MHGCWAGPQVLLGTLLQRGDWGQFLGDLHTVRTVEDAELEGTSDKPQPQCFPGSILPPLEDVVHHCRALLSKVKCQVPDYNAPVGHQQPFRYK